MALTAAFIFAVTIFSSLHNVVKSFIISPVVGEKTSVYLSILLFFLFDAILSYVDVGLFRRKIYELEQVTIMTFSTVNKNPVIFVPIVILTEILGTAGEELVFRYFAIKALKQKFNRRRTVIFLSSLIWTLMHGNVNLGHFIFGLLLGFIYYETESLSACILLHFLLNLTSLSVPFYIFYKELGKFTLSPFQYGVTLLVTQVIFYQLIGMLFIKVKGIKDSPI